MPSEDELREQFHTESRGRGVGGDIDHGAIDLGAVLRRSRARRRPRVAAVAIVSSLAVLGVVVPVSISVASSQTTTSVLGAGSAASASDEGKAPQADGGGRPSGPAGGAPVFTEGLNLCGAALTTPAPAADGLVLTVQPVDAAASARDIPVVVTLTNTGTAEVTGSLSPFPALTLSRDGVVLWHSNGPVPLFVREIDLAPGASTTFQSTFEPVVCGPADDAQSSFRSDLPPVGAGDYQLSAALDFTPETGTADGGAGAVLVTGPTSLVTLH
jgi:hypothetical protein